MVLIPSPITTNNRPRLNNYQATPALAQDNSEEALPAIQIDRSRYETLLTEADLTRWVKNSIRPNFLP